MAVSILLKIKNKFGKSAFKIGLILLGICIVCYVLSFAQMLLPISLTAKGVLWFIFFGTAKTLQYTAITIMGADGFLKLKKMWKERKKSPDDNQ